MVSDTVNNRREIAFGRLLAIANVLSERVFEKGKPSIMAKYLDRYQRKPFETFFKIHQELIEYSHKFGSEELQLLDLFQEIINDLSMEDADQDVPLQGQFMQVFHSQQHVLHTLDNIMGTEEAAETWGLSQDHVKRLCREGKVKAVRIGQVWVLEKNQSKP